MALQLATSTAYLRDKFVPFKEANLSIASSPILYGLSIYSVMSLNWNEHKKKLYVFRLEEHYARLVNSAQIMDFNSFAQEWPYAKFKKTVLELIRLNNVKEDALVRVTVFIDEISPGTRMHDLKNSVSIHIFPLGEVLPRSGAHLCVSSWLRSMDNAIPAKAKVNGSYVNASLMKNEAILNGYDDAIALDHNEHVAESTVSNLFIVRGGVLATPDASTDILEGITRDSLLVAARRLNMPIEERSIDRTELYKIDEAFLCGTSVVITPILSIDKRVIGGGKPGPVTQRLIKEYEKILHGGDERFASWLTEV